MPPQKQALVLVRPIIDQKKEKSEIVISISRNGLLKACVKFIIERIEISLKVSISSVEWCFLRYGRKVDLFHRI